MITRNQLIENARKNRNEIAQLFTDAAYWNNHVRPPGVAAINPDPDGQLARIAAAYDAMLSREIPGYEPPK